MPCRLKLQKFKEIYDKKTRNEIINEARSVLDINTEDLYENKSFGHYIKNTRFNGKFLNKQEVEEFIKAKGCKNDIGKEVEVILKEVQYPYIISEVNVK